MVFKKEMGSVTKLGLYWVYIIDKTYYIDLL